MLAGFFYETVAPILSIGSASLVAISTLTSEINFYTRLIKMNDPATDRPLFVTRCIELCCAKCKEEGKQAECNHLLHLVPSWQSEERHRKLKIMMQDRPVSFMFHVGPNKPIPSLGAMVLGHVRNVGLAMTCKSSTGPSGSGGGFPVVHVVLVSGKHLPIFSLCYHCVI